MAVNSLNFGVFNDVQRQNATSSTTLEITCDPGLVSYQITISAGNSGVFNPRHMMSGEGNALNYNLYTDPTYQTIWGDGQTTGAITATGVNCAQTGQCTYNIYGLIRAGDNPAPYVGSYTDNLVITLNFQ